MSTQTVHKRKSFLKNTHYHGFQSKSTSYYQSNNSSIYERVLQGEFKNTTANYSENDESFSYNSVNINSPNENMTLTSQESHKFLDLNQYAEFNNNDLKIVKKIGKKGFLFPNYETEHEKFMKHSTHKNLENLTQQPIHSSNDMTYQKNQDSYVCPNSLNHKKSFENKKLYIENNLSCNDLNNQSNYQEALKNNTSLYTNNYSHYKSNKDIGNYIVTEKMTQASIKSLIPKNNAERIQKSNLFDSKNNKSILSNTLESITKTNSFTPEIFNEKKSKHTRSGYMLTNFERKYGEFNIQCPDFENIKFNIKNNNSGQIPNKNAGLKNSDSTQDLKLFHTLQPKHSAPYTNSNLEVSNDCSDKNCNKNILNKEIDTVGKRSVLKVASQTEEKLLADVSLTGHHSRSNKVFSHCSSTAFSSDIGENLFSCEYRKYNSGYIPTQIDENPLIIQHMDSNYNFDQRIIGTSQDLNSNLIFDSSNTDYNSRAENEKYEDTGPNIKINQLLTKMSSTNLNADHKKQNISLNSHLNDSLQQKVIASEPQTNKLILQKKRRATAISQVNTPTRNATSARNRYYPNLTNEKKKHYESIEKINYTESDLLSDEKSQRLVRSSSENLRNHSEFLSSLKELSSSFITTTKNIFQKIGQSKSQRMKCHCKNDLNDEETCPIALKWLFSRYNSKDMEYLKNTYRKLSQHNDIDPKSKKQIYLDINRTYPDSPLFISEKG